MPPARSSEITSVYAHAAAAASTSQPSSSRAAPRAGRPAKSRKFYIVARSRGTRGSGFELLNDRALFQGGPPIFVPPPGRRGFRDYPETPVFLSDARLGRTDRDFEEYCGYWFISDRTKAVLDRVDSAAFAFLKCRVQLPDGTDGPVRWLCDVVPVLDALDEEKSKIAIRTAGDGSKVYNFFGGENLVFREDAVGPHHVFRMMFFDAKIIGDEEMRLACKAGDITGVRFLDPTDR
jgi:Protein of unknown function (DUF1629)